MSESFSAELDSQWYKKGHPSFFFFFSFSDKLCQLIWLVDLL